MLLYGPPHESWQFSGTLQFSLRIPRLLYDCLVHWTGAGPAEHFSVKKRPSYSEYQSHVRCFFPFPLPFIDHHCLPGWPNFEPLQKDPRLQGRQLQLDADVGSGSKGSDFQVKAS